jgi:hypothetical protein
MKEDLLKAIDLANNGKWEEAHQIAQQIDHPAAEWLHANLHREEGDKSNASYWYNRCNLPYCTQSITDERKQIAKSLN